MKKAVLYSLATCLLAFASFGSFAQNTFRSESNPMYWKNKMPFAGYWQQDVAYRIKANIDETLDVVGGDEQLTYFNNSPDTLRFVYFNLYQNAFQPGSYLDDLQIHNGEKVKYGKYEKNKQGTIIDQMSAGDVPLKTKLDNTVLKVFLDKPLAPNESTTFTIKFRTFFDAGSTRRRMKEYKSPEGHMHYNGCQWYPKICVYDRKSGWNTDQHLNREFYGDFGSFDVELTFASNYVVEATGILQNEKEVLPDDLKAKLQIRNFKDKKPGEKASVITPYNPNERKTWKYHADNVHDFAWTADPTYRIADTMWNGVRCVAICEETHAPGWQNSAKYCARIIKCFSLDIGMYEYPKMVIADAEDGMEYPMITMDRGTPPTHGLLVHEIGHNWFYGMLGNNETYRAMMDEGFTQFLTVWGLEHLDGDTIKVGKMKNKYVQHFSEPSMPRDGNSYMGYLRDATFYNDETINTHSDMFNGALGQGGGYGMVYNKTATMLYNLQYVLGDSVFKAALKHYVAQWKICHPYPEDFRNSFIQFTHVDLNWFFDQWMETSKNIDYKIASVKKGKEKDQYKIKLVRKGRMQMPIDLRVVAKNDSIYDYLIPNTWYEKDLHQKQDAPHTKPMFQQHDSVLHKWYGWDKLAPTYIATVTIQGGVKNVIIDPTDRLADINNYNNRWRKKVEVRFDSHILPPTSWKKYRIWMRPDLWYNSYDGFQLGYNVKGSYFNVKHKFDFTIWFNTHLAQGGAYHYSDADLKKAGWVSYMFSYSTPITKSVSTLRSTSFYFQSRWLDGCEMYKLGIVKNFPSNFTLDINFKGFTRQKAVWSNYLINQNEWSTYWDGPNKFNASLNLSGTYNYAKTAAAGSITAHLRSSTLSATSNYHYLELTHIDRVSFWRLDLRSRVYGRIGTGNNLPSESALYFAGANEEDMMDNKYMRAAGFAPQQWSGYGPDVNHLQYGGGLDLRGYAGYAIQQFDKYGQVVPVYKGQSGFAVNGELDFNRIVKVKNQKLKDIFALNTYLFGDMGAMAFTNSRGGQELSQVRFDGGAGVALTIKKWGFLQDIKPLTFRFDVPFLLSATPAGDNRYVKFRWVVGISRAF
jgi:aminopeptidase N